VFYRQIKENRQTVIRAFLVFDGAADCDVAVSVPPAGWRIRGKAVYAFGEKQKFQIAANPHYPPRFFPPNVGFFK
jgi:hypothetical protein